MFRSLTSKIKQVALQHSEMETKVMEATNNEPWGPTATQMQGIITLYDRTKLLS